MAIIITDKFQLRQKNFLDDRQGIASSVSTLKSWNYSTVPIPEGFEVYVGGVWYIYRSSHPDDPVTGRFKTRTDSDGVDDLKVRVKRLEFEDGRDVASTFAEIKTEAFWKDSTGVNHARAGRIVTVTSDSDDGNNGPWYLISSDYTKTDSWMKLIDRGDLVTTTGGATVSNTSVYTSSKTDATFPKKASSENITAKWIFKEDQVFEKDLTTKTLHATTGTITNLSSTTGNITGLTSGTANITNGNVTTLKSTTGTITNLSSTTGNITNLSSETANIGTGTITTLNSTTGTITNLNSTTGKITTLTSEVANIEEGTVDTLNSTNSIAEYQTVTEKLQTTGKAILKEVEVGTNGSIKDEDGKTVARVDKIVAEESELADLDQQIRDQMGLIGVGNLLKNTSFLGQFKSKDMKEGTPLREGTVVYNSKIDDWDVTSDWEIVEDSDAVTGYSINLIDTKSMISQETFLTLCAGTSYILSWKQKGEIEVEIQGYDLEIQTILQNSRYKFCYTKIVPTTNGKERVFFKGGPGNVFEIKFEEGILPTSWFPSCMDTDPVASRSDSYEFLKSSFIEYPENISGLFLKDQIKVGEIINDEVRNTWGGISGVFNDETDIMLWSGGSYENAIDLISKIDNNSAYLDDLPESALRNLTKAIITFGSKTILTDLYAAGKFKGQHLDEEGIEITSFNKVTGFLPAVNGSSVTKVGFTAGRLEKVDGTYPTSINFGGTNITFLKGYCTESEGQYTISTGSAISGVSKLHLIFHKGYLVKVSSVKDYNSNYYWFS